MIDITFWYREKWQGSMEAYKAPINNFTQLIQMSAFVISDMTAVCNRKLKDPIVSFTKNPILLQ